MKKALLNMIAVTLPTLLVIGLILEGFFRVGIPASNPPLGHFDPAESMYRFNPATPEGLYTIGPVAEQQGNWQVNNAGWISSVDYRPKGQKPRVAIIGDSFVEALQVDVGQAFPALIRKEIRDNQDILSFGVAGAPLSQYLHMTRYVVKNYDPETIIINVVHNDFGESIFEANPDSVQFMRLRFEPDRIYEIQPTTDGGFVENQPLKAFVRKSALVRYLFLNLGVQNTWKRLFDARYEHRRYVANVDVDTLAEYENKVARAVDYVVSSLATENPNRRIVVYLDGRRQRIYDSSLRPSDEVEELGYILKRACEKHGLEFVDLHQVMASDYAANGLPFNTEIDNHWNAYGHEVVAAHMARSIEQSK